MHIFVFTHTLTHGYKFMHTHTRAHTFTAVRTYRCIKRYHRALFIWYIGIVLNNMIVLFDLLSTDAVKLRQSKRGMGYKHWFQNELGNVLINHGMKLAEDAWLERNAGVIIKFLRHVYTFRSRRHRKKCRDAVTVPRVFRDRTNSRSRRNLGGRPRKKKHAGGRPKRQQQQHQRGPITPVVCSNTTCRSSTPTLPAVIQNRLSSFVFANPKPPFVPKRRGRSRKGKATSDGKQIGCVTHRRVHTKTLQGGKGRVVPLRSRCVNCYAAAPAPIDDVRKTYMSDGSIIPSVTFACDVCRVVLCKTCFWSVYDHRQRGKPVEYVTFR